MYLLSNFDEADSTRAALMRSGLELLAERGYKGTTTREIAARAGVSEVTLFRQFGSKKALLQAAVQKLRPPVEQVLPHPPRNLEARRTQAQGELAENSSHGEMTSSSLEDNLLHLTERYVQMLEANQGLLVRLLPELARHPELRGASGPAGFSSAISAVLEYITGLQKVGLLRSDESPFQAAIALLGPLFARGLLLGAMGIQPPFDLKAHVRGFLEGRRYG
ncbi:TetR/AcrR family transcriptional regulator [Meiothermus cerbereus]|jgi:AcrR family transcriptional regulator|uniref:TetR/AcrR family transcriptional regulator n=1 Tax=Meiothermus cerbereus TaxID=65552 RepID=UPI0004899EB7|nr:TetR/AcrR family transcriptional regulator [Meiothermus cerbereus]